MDELRVMAVEDSEVEQGTVDIENVVNPNHYQNTTIQTLYLQDLIIHNLKGSDARDIATAIKYLSRYRYKGGDQDIAKARQYVNIMASRNGWNTEFTLDPKQIHEDIKTAVKWLNAYDWVAGIGLEILKEHIHKEEC